eukprot:jgi/Phyca11/528281/estExt2_fgenesh1_pm.C_PHYCAscaffold_280043
MGKLSQRSSVADPSTLQHIGPFEHLCIASEDVFELILSFLSNQTLTKLHAITGDFYPNCEPDLAPFCCACDNDNPKVFDGVCRRCQSKKDGYTSFVEKEVATTETNKSLLWQSSRRFAALLTALKSRGLQLRPGSKLCERFIIAGDGDIASIVDTMEEMRFLNGCTDYPRRCQREIDSIRDDTDVKMELCISYLENPKGFKLPRKWENCRSRFEEVQRAGGIPQCEMRYIYSE